MSEPMREEVERWIVEGSLVGLQREEARVLPAYLALLDEQNRRNQQLKAVAEAAGVETPMQLTALAENDEQTTAELLAVFVRRLREERDRLRGEKTRWKAEAEMLRGVGCMEDGDGPCGVCLKCLRARNEKLERVLSQIAEATKNRTRGDGAVWDYIHSLAQGAIDAAEEKPWAKR